MQAVTRRLLDSIEPLCSENRLDVLQALMGVPLTARELLDKLKRFSSLPVLQNLLTSMTHRGMLLHEGSRGPKGYTYRPNRKHPAVTLFLIALDQDKRNQRKVS